MKITIYGAGAFGSALGEILRDNGHTITYYDPKVYPEQGLTQAIDFAEVNILCVPSTAAPKLLLFLPHDKPLILASKGFISDASFKAFGNYFMVLSGGAFAADLVNKKPSVLTSTAPFIDQLFQTSWLTFDHTNDKLGSLICGSLKNVYAIGSGYWGLTYGTRDFDDFINSALDEMRAILAANNCDPKTVELSCGLRDLVITCASTASRNYEFGTRLKKEPDLGVKFLKGQAQLKTTEGIFTAIQVKNSPSFVKPENTPVLDRIVSLIIHR
jgi:glycerol-3-phosphate dehydrogenase (NAD(P)+)